MRAYSELYLNDVVENQGKLFDLVANEYTMMDTEDFINAYMMSKTRKAIDESQAYVNTMDARTLWDYFVSTEGYCLKSGDGTLDGFFPMWLGEFYAYYQNDQFQLQWIIIAINFDDRISIIERIT